MRTYAVDGRPALARSSAEALFARTAQDHAVLPFFGRVLSPTIYSHHYRGKAVVQPSTISAGIGVHLRPRLT
jgi:hypothetical protein